MLSPFVTSLLSRVTGSDDEDVLKASCDDRNVLQVLRNPRHIRAVEEIRHDRANIEKYREIPAICLVAAKEGALPDVAVSSPRGSAEGFTQMAPSAYDLEDWAGMAWFAKDYNIGKRLQEKGFCILKGDMSSDERHRAVSEASQLRRTGGFERLPGEVLSGYFGELGSAWTRSLSEQRREEEEALHAVEARLIALGSDLAHGSASFSGLRLQGHTAGMVHCSRGVEDQPNPPLSDPDVANYYLALFMRKKLKLFYFLGPSPAMVTIAPLVMDEDQVAVFRTVLQPGSLVVLRAEACRCFLEPHVAEPCVTVEVDFMASQRHGHLENQLDRVAPPEELQSWLVGRLRAIVDNDVEENVPEEWIKLARQTFLRSRPSKISEVSHQLPSSAPGGKSCPWEGICLGGNDSIVEIPKSKWDVDLYFDPDPDHADDFKMYSRHMGVLDNMGMLLDEQEYADFGILPEESASVDARQVGLYRSASECFGQAGLGKNDTRGQSIGFFCGISGNEMHYQLMTRQVRLNKSSAVNFSNAANINRIAWLFGTKGPSVVLDTEDSSGLAALDTAVTYVREGRCSKALACGANLVQYPFSLIVCCASGLLSGSGRCRPFDESSDGIVRSESVVCLLLEPHGPWQRKLLDGSLSAEESAWMGEEEELEEFKDLDLSKPRLIILGSALNSKGLSSSLTAPSSSAIKDVIQSALKDARSPAKMIDGVEVNAGGSQINDAIELAVIRNTLQTNELKPHVVLSCVKSVLGDSGPPSGLVGVVRACLQLQKAVYCPTVHLKQMFQLGEHDHEPDEAGASAASPLLNTELFEGLALQQTLGVSSFGTSGTSVHNVISGSRPTRNDVLIQPKKPLRWFPGSSNGVLESPRESVQSEYHLVGTWNAWQPIKMEEESEGVYGLTVVLGENRWETFQIWENGDPDKVLHPGTHWADQDASVCGPCRGDLFGRYATWRLSGRAVKVLLVNEEQAREMQLGSNLVAKYTLERGGETELLTQVAFPEDYQPDGYKDAAADDMPVLEQNTECIGRPGDRYRVRLLLSNKQRRVEWRKLPPSPSLNPEEASNDLHKYFVTGDFNHWTFREMEEVISARTGGSNNNKTRRFRAEVQLSRDGGQFQVVRDQDWDQTFYPDREGGNDSFVLGPDAFGQDIHWCLNGKAGDTFEVEFQRTCPGVSGADEKLISWRHLKHTSLNAEMTENNSYSIIGSWSDFMRRESMTYHKDTSSWVVEVKIGKSGCEFFQLLLNDNWLAAVYPNSNEANFRDPGHKLLGPDAQGSSLYWALGRHEEDGLAEGDSVRVSLQVTGGTPKAVRWEKC